MAGEEVPKLCREVADDMEVMSGVKFTLYGRELSAVLSSEPMHESCERNVVTGVLEVVGWVRDSCRVPVVSPGVRETLALIPGVVEDRVSKFLGKLLSCSGATDISKSCLCTLTFVKVVWGPE